MFRRKENLTLAFVENSFINYNSEKNEVVGGLVIRRIYENYKDFGFSLNVVKSVIGKKAENGTLIGMYEDIVNEKVDTSIVALPLNTAPEKITVSPAIYNVDMVIISAADEAKKVVVDVITSLNCISTSTSLIIMFTLICGYIVACRQLKWFDYISSIFGQWYSEGFNRLNKFTICLALFFLVVVEYHVLAAFSSDLTVTIPPPTADTLNDVVKLNKIPQVVDLIEWEPYFRDPHSEGHVVWEYMKRIGFDKCVVHVNDKMQLNLLGKLQLILSGIYVSFLSPEVAPILHRLWCALCEDTVIQALDAGRRPHISKPFYTSVIVFPVGRHLNGEKALKLHFFYYAQVEQGFYNYLARDVADAYTPFQINLGCERRFLLLLDEETEYADLPLAGFKGTFAMLLLFWCMSVVVFFTEFATFRLATKSN